MATYKVGDKFDMMNREVTILKIKKRGTKTWIHTDFMDYGFKMFKRLTTPIIKVK